MLNALMSDAQTTDYSGVAYGSRPDGPSYEQLWKNDDRAATVSTTRQPSFRQGVLCYDIGWLIDVEAFRQLVLWSPEGYLIYTIHDENESSSLSVSDMVEKSRKVLGLTASQVAELVGVSRAALYKHINNEPPRDLSAYQNLYDLATRIDNEVGPIEKGLKNVIVDGKTFLRHLYDKPENSEVLLDIARQVGEKLKTRKSGESGSISEQRISSRSISKGG